MRKFKFNIFCACFIILFSCNENLAMQSSLQSISIEKKIADSLLFTFNSDVYSGTLKILKSKEIFFKKNRDESAKMSGFSKKINYISLEQIREGLDIPEDKMFQSGDTIIGSPYTHDQGGYELEIYYNDNSKIHVSIDTNHEHWPYKSNGFIKNLENIYIKISTKEFVTITGL